MRGYLFLLYITLIAFILLKEEVGSEYTVEEILIIMRNLKCKVHDKDIIIQELTKQQKAILQKLKFITPKSSEI